MVVPQLPHFQPEWAVPAWTAHLLRRRDRVVVLDRVAVFAKIHRNEDSANTRRAREQVNVQKVIFKCEEVEKNKNKCLKTSIWDNVENNMDFCCC